jgi:hypothetical protein
VIQAPLPREIADALGLTAGGAHVRLGLAQNLQPVILWPMEERSAELIVADNGLSYHTFGFQAAVAAQYSHVQLWNPLTSGRRLILWDLTGVAIGAAMTFGLRHYNAALTNLFHTPQPKRVHTLGASPATQCRVQTNAAPLGTQFGYFAMAASNSFVVPLKVPLIIDPGCSVVVVNDTVNQVCAASFGFDEEEL